MTTRKLFVNDGHTEKELLIVGTVSVGRDPACNIHNLDPLLSRKHAEFAWSRQHVTIRDLDSRNGILVNGVKVREQVLKSGDVVQAGGLQLRFVETSSVNTEDEHTRARERTDTAVETPTLAPTAPPTAAKKPVQADTVTAPAMPGADPDATFVAGQQPPRSAAFDPDATFLGAGAVAPSIADARLTPGAAAARDLDATIAPGVRPPAAPVAASAALSTSRDADATIANFGQPAGNFDVTIAPVRKPASASAAASAPAAAAAARRAPAEAEIVVNRQLVVTSANAGCVELFGVRPEALVGGSAAEVLVKSLSAIAAPDGPPGLSIALARTTADGTLTLTFKAAQAAETVR